MFTGIITDIGRVAGLDGGPMRIACSFDPAGIAIGASIACDGCCLTVTEVSAGPEGRGAVFAVEASNETLARTTLGGWRPGRRVNLERALTLQDELGGHLMTGHVDGVAEIVARAADGRSARFTIAAPEALARFIAAKGSVALDGISLTVNEVSGSEFGVNMIPHTLGATSWDARAPGDKVNLEVDLLARYVARIAEVQSTR